MTGRGTAQDLLDAAAALFCTVGYTATSTYAIAERAGVRQASMYHHFPNKHAMLLELLLGTVRPSLANADRLGSLPAPATARLWALCHADVELLCAPRENLGALYLLPELADDRFAEFRRLHAALRLRYAELVRAVPGVPATEATALAGLAFGLVESVILRRRDEPDLAGADAAPRVADAVQRLLGVGGDALEGARAGGLALLGAPSAARTGGDAVAAEDAAAAEGAPASASADRDADGDADGRADAGTDRGTDAAEGPGRI